MTITQYQPAALRTANLRALSLDEAAFDRLHACLGLSTEAAELMEAWECGNETHIREEVGDMLWYLPLLCRGLQINLTDLFMDENFGTSVESVGTPEAIVQLSAKLLNAQKKAVAYEKYVPTTFYIDTVRILVRKLAMLAERYGFTLAEAADSNIAKLRVRYPKGFANEDAVVRDLHQEGVALAKKSE